MLKAIAKSVLPKSIWNALRSYKIKKMADHFPAYEVTHHYGGHKFKVYISDPLAKGWYDKPWEALDEITFLKKFDLGEGAKIFNLGAHQSVFAMMLARESGETGRVLAVEANTHNYQAGLKNKEINQVENLEIINSAVGQENGHVLFSGGFNGSITHEDSTTLSTKVTSLTVDTLIEKYFEPDFIFMDIEGFEVHALKACKKALELPCHWSVEVHGPEYIGRFGGTVQEVLDFFPEDKFDLYISDENTRYEQYNPNSSLLDRRFFLIAIKK